MPAPTEITPAEVQRIVERGEAVCLLDVRETWEYENAHLPGVLLIPLGELPRRCAAELDFGEPIVCICEHGVRSAHAARFLAGQGCKNASTMTGGMAGYAGPVETLFTAETLLPESLP